MLSCFVRYEIRSSDILDLSTWEVNVPGGHRFIVGPVTNLNDYFVPAAHRAPVPPSNRDAVVTVPEKGKYDPKKDVGGQAVKSVGLGCLLAPLIFFVGFGVFCLALFVGAKAIPTIGDIAMYPFAHTPSGRPEQVVQQPATQQATRQQARKPASHQVAPKNRHGR